MHNFIFINLHSEKPVYNKKHIKNKKGWCNYEKNEACHNWAGKKWA